MNYVLMIIFACLSSTSCISAAHTQYRSMEACQEQARMIEEANKGELAADCVRMDNKGGQQ